MEYYSVIIVLLAIALIASPIAKKIKVAYPILLLVIGIIVGFIPGFKFVPINPEIVFLLFLPPLLYDAASNISYTEFKKNFRTISMMAISLVFVTMGAIAVIAHLLVPDISWSLAFVLGAILSPPDAVAAAGVTKEINLSHRIRTILEGESLINDASALIAYRVTVGIVLGGVFDFWGASMLFLVSLVGGCLIGFFLSSAYGYIVRKIKLEETVIICLNLLLPFVAYLISEELNVSGVLAVVVLGLGIINSKHIKQDRLAIKNETTQKSESIWSVLVFILNGLIFLLIGLELPIVLNEIAIRSIPTLVLCSFAIFLVAVAVRIVVLYRHKVGINRMISAVGNMRRPMPQKRMEQMKNIEAFTWKDVIIMGCSGMRGIVSLATAIALPIYLPSGDFFPLRNEILFVTVLTVVLMLLVQGLGLPYLIKYLQPETKEEEGNA